MSKYLIGFDIGSSSIKAALVNAETRETVGMAQYPETEMEIQAVKTGWAEQDPELWWDYIGKVCQKLLTQTNVNGQDVESIGLSYQMHGLVLVDKDQKVLRPSIIWCDSRSVEIGNEAFKNIGEEKCLSHLLNSPGNFTASKLKWVQDNEPEVYKKVHKFMLPGDFIGMKMTGKIVTTKSGLSEGILWDFQNNDVAQFVLDHYNIDRALVPEIADTFSIQGQVTETAAEFLGIKAGTPVTYRAGDQPNNALALQVTKPGEIAATGGTSGVVYAVVDQPLYDKVSRVNGFAHVNHQAEAQRIGVLLCINGAGSQYRWIKQQVAGDNITYDQMEEMINTVPVGADDLRVIPFGNGAERMLENHFIGAQINNVQFNIHGKAHMYRAALEGVAFAFVYGVEILKEMGIETHVIKVGNDNLFRSKVFSTTVATLTGCTIEVIETTGAVGAARGSGLATGRYAALDDIYGKAEKVNTYQMSDDVAAYKQAYNTWKKDLENLLKNK
ncbi:xylulokinase [Fulvivirga sediminis]|uniref:Carbohydrate kinase n=1 Tax=Fulvivirga sediminis TaxID=2803949 RepID=A0A937F7A8_9BACT|nr:FGGY family carbohydrate kinase [Fulvivirga sediminis]MBL3655408.1 carbohydrate kinase [Fulvivirga sediminis]